MEKLTEFLQMGDYAGFVWSAYLSAGVILGGVITLTLRLLRKTQRQLAALQATSSSYEA